jgi:riboflavin biosynthesis pyrimidine reductase
LKEYFKAIMVGSRTALQDDPKLTVRGISLPQDKKNPLRVVVDGDGKITQGNLLDISLAPTLILTTKKVSQTSKY